MSLQRHRRRLLAGVYTDMTVEGEDLRNAVAASSRWQKVTFKKAKLARADFLSSRFEQCRFEDCDLSQTRFAGSNIYDTEFIRCDGDQSDFSACDLQRVSFAKSRLQYSVWNRAYFLRGGITDSDLHGALLDFAQTDGLDFRGSSFWGAVVPFGCQIFNKNKFDDRQVQLLLGLVCQIDGDTDAIRNIVAPKYLRLVDRLLRHTSA